MMNRIANKNRQSAAFTLIELLVVVGIIGLLISIVTPSLRKARGMARNAQCLSRLRAVYLANSFYVGQEGRYPGLNNEEDDGTWQYNYLIYDGRDFEQNFGPLVRDRGEIEYIEQLFCPVQQDPHHTLATELNPWPVRPLFDTRAGYARRYHLSGKSPSQIKRTIGFAADLMHLPSVIRSGHKTGLNAVYTDGNARWVSDPGIFTDNELAHPFQALDNPIVKEIWGKIDDAL